MEIFLPVSTFAEKSLFHTFNWDNHHAEILYVV